METELVSPRHHVGKQLIWLSLCVFCAHNETWLSICFYFGLRGGYKELGGGYAKLLCIYHWDDQPWAFSLGARPWLTVFQAFFSPFLFPARRKRTQAKRCWLRLPRLFFLFFVFSTLLYQQFTEIASASTMGREPPTHQALFKHTFLRCWERSKTTMLPWSSSKGEEGLSGVNLLQTWERFSVGI